MNPMDIMAAIVIRENRTLYKVFPYCRSICRGPKPITKPEMTAAIRMPLPVADSQLKLNTAPSGALLATTGGTLRIRLCRPLTGILKTEILSRMALTLGNPQRKTSTLRMTQGTQALATSPALCPCWPRALRSASCPSNPQIFLGCQSRSKTITAAMEQTAETTSTSHGPWKLDTRNCGIAKNTPATSTAGQISSIPLNPAKAHKSQKGTRTEKNGRIRPAMPLSCNRSRPVTAPRTPPPLRDVGTRKCG